MKLSKLTILSISILACFISNSFANESWKNYLKNYEIRNCKNIEASYSIEDSNNEFYYINVTVITSSTSDQLRVSDNSGLFTEFISGSSTVRMGPYKRSSKVQLTTEDLFYGCTVKSEEFSEIENNLNFLQVTDQLTPEEIVTDYLMSSPCSQVYNITYSTGTNFSSTSNGIAYFYNNNTSFPITDGLLLSTGDFAEVPGPETGSQIGDEGWPGDQELENIIPDLDSSNDATILEFDFIPFSTSISFNYLFASDEYGVYQCTFTDAFAFLLTDSQGNTQNLALVPGSNDPVSVTSICDDQYNNDCPSQNIQYFDDYYGPSPGATGLDPSTAPIDFRGNTVILNASSPVNIGEEYHIKLVIADRLDTILNSTVFIEAGSFDVGEIDLGSDIVATCDQQSVILDSGLPANFVGEVEWFYDDQLILDANGNPIETPTITVDEPGEYSVSITINDADECSKEDSITVTFENGINLDLPEETSVCSEENFVIDATPSNQGNFSTLNYNWYYNGNLITNETNSQLTATQSGTYTVEIFASGSSTCPDTTLIEVIEVEILDYQVDFNQNTYICSNDPITEVELVPQITGLSATELENASYLWQNGDETETLTVNTSGTYEVSVFYEGCEQTAEIAINFITSPTFEGIEDYQICPNQSVLVEPTVTNPQFYDSFNFTWYDSSGNVISNSSELTISEEGIYSINITGELPNGETCETLEEFTITQLDIQIELPTDQNICEQADFLISPQISGQDVINPSYSWQDENGNELASTSELLVSSSGVFTLFLTTDNCTVSKEISINFFSEIETTLQEFIYSCDEISDLPTLNATPSNINGNTVSYQWYFNDNILNGENSATLESSLYGYGNYEVTIAINAGNNDCLLKTVQTSIINEQTSSISIASNRENNTFCLTEEVEIYVDVIPDNNQVFMWEVNGSLIDETSDTLSFEMTQELSSPILVSVSTGEGICEVSNSIEIFKYDNENCVITDGLSPETSVGFNDFLDLNFLNDRSGINSLKVFNRYGKLVYKRNNYSNQFKGQDLDGNNLLTGTYFYIIELDSDDPVFGKVVKDWLYINREAN